MNMFSNSFLTDLVNLDGRLNTTCISHKESIYTARNGQHIERFIYRNKSYIYKPCSAEAIRRERWAHDHLTPLMPNVRVPNIMASGEANDPMINWIIYEDLGSLVHCNNTDEIIRAAGVIQEWHSIPAQKVPEGWVGHSPDYAQVLKILNADIVRINSTLEATGVSHSTVLSWWAQLPNWERFIQERYVVSHGDYYKLNIAFQYGQSIVLDWEFVHLNSVYWDLYSLMDITSYRYARVALESADREATLQQYWVHSKTNGSPEQYRDFILGYYIFASVYSVWILSLIEADLAQSAAPAGALRRQQRETADVFLQCLQGLNIKHVK